MVIISYILHISLSSFVLDVKANVLFGQTVSNQEYLLNYILPRHPIIYCRWDDFHLKTNLSEKQVCFEFTCIFISDPFF